MAKIKRFLIIYVLVYIVVATGINMVYGPPNMPKEYLSEYKVDHDRYLEAVKNSDYKLWAQRPELIETPDAQLQDRIEYVAEYEAREAYQKEAHRRHSYNLLFEFFNAGMVVVLIVGLAKGPVGTLVDGMIASIREQLDETESTLKASEERIQAAQAKIAGLDQDLAGNAEFVEERIENIRRDAALFTGQSLSRLNKEVENRKNNEEIKARQALKEVAVDAAIEQILEQFKSNGTVTHNEALIKQFVAELEKSS